MQEDLPMKPILIAAALAVLTTAACDTDVLTADRETTVSSVGTVREIDAANRRFVVRSDGRVLTLRATETVRNFDQLAVGDRIHVNYRESVAVSMAAPSDPGQTEAISIGMVAPQGARPGMAEAEAISVVMQFIAYDPRSRAATLRTGNGDILRFNVPREMRSFARARQPGDRIAITFERAAAITVEPAE
jgi:hypothetical protein